MAYRKGKGRSTKPPHPGLITALFWYTILLAVSIMRQVYDVQPASYIILILLAGVPLWYVRPLPFAIKPGDVLLALYLGILFIVPYLVFTKLFLSGLFILPPYRYLIYQLVAVALPEELFFRAYLQGTLGNKRSSLIIVSILFALCHGGRFYVTGNLEALLTFFPSLAMGWLYKRTSNLPAPVLFHFLANSAYTSMN